MVDITHAFGGRAFKANPPPSWLRTLHEREQGLPSSRVSPAANDSLLSDQWRIPVEAGWSVFPLSRGSKRASIKWEPFQSTRASGDAISHWAMANSNTAIVTGRLSGLFVLDFDTEEALQEAKHLGLPETVEAQTPRGRHFYFKYPDFAVSNRAGFPFLGADVRGEGGYVVAPGSTFEPDAKERADGKAPGAYQWLASPQDTKLAPAPEWLLERMRSFIGRAADRTGLPLADAWISQAVNGELERVRTAPVGERNHALNRAAFNLGQLETRLDFNSTRQMLLAAGLAVGLSENEALRTIDSGWRGGCLNPRQTGEFDPALFENREPGFRPLVLSPLKEVRTPAPPFPLDVLGEKWGDWVASEASGASAPADYVAMALLVATAALLGNARRCSPWQPWEEPSILWGCVVGEPSAGKTPALRPVLQLLKPIDAEFSKQFEKQMLDYQRLSVQADAARQKWKKQATDPNGQAPPLPAEANPPDEPACPALKVDDVTPEKLGHIAKASPKGLLLFRDEIAGWLGDMDRYRGNGERALWLTAYNGDERRIDRQKTPFPIIIPRFSVSILGGIQPDRFNAAFGSTVDDGLIARFLFTWPEPVERRKPEAPLPWQQRWAENAVGRLFAIGFAQDEYGEPVPRVHLLSDEAEHLFEGWWKREQNHPADGLAKSAWGKMPGQTVRLALVLEFLWWSAVDQQREPDQISAGAVQAAIRLIDTYFKPMALRVFREAAIPADIAVTSLLARFIVDKRLERFNVRLLTRAEGRCAGRPMRLAKREVLLTACDGLVDAGWLAEVHSRDGDSKGRGRLDYIVNPLLWEQIAD